VETMRRIVPNVSEYVALNATAVAEALAWFDHVLLIHAEYPPPEYVAGLNMEPRFHQTGSELSLRVEYYEQIVDDPRTAPTDLQGLNLYPNLKAVLVQVGFSY